MGKPHPLALRERVVAFVEEGNSHRSSAAHFRVSVKFVNDMVKLKRETGGLEASAQGRRGHGKLAIVAGWVREQMDAHPATTLDELRAALEREHGIRVHRSSVGGLLHRLGLSHKKRSAGQRTEAARCGAGQDHLDYASPTLHAQPSGTAHLYR